MVDQRRGPGEGDPFDGMEVPEALLGSLQRHRENVARFIRSLQSAGVNEAQVEYSVSVIIESYRQELLGAIHAMVR